MEPDYKGIASNQVEMKSIIYYEVDEVITKYDEQIFRYLKKRDYKKCEQTLSDFCFELLELSDVEQVFIARTFFVSIITDIIRIQQRRGRLHPRNLSFAYELIAEIEKWENISEFILNSTYYMEELRAHVLTDYLVAIGCSHMTKALELIDLYLEEDFLTVNYLAQELKISTTHLTNLFKLKIGEPVSEYITRRKLNEIVFEMTYTSKPLKEIREKYGYLNHSHFIQQFKKTFGKTPLQYRQHINDN